jgi:hypothetical protein
VAVAHGWSHELPTNAVLRLANTKEPQGVYREVREGHLLRWIKQEATRGSCRSIDAHGNAAPMEIYTSADLGRLLKNWTALFPDAPPPVLLGGGVQERSGPERLVRLLADPKRAEVTSGEVESLAGVERRRLSRTVQYDQVRDAMDCYRWDFIASRGRNAGASKFVRQQV